MVGIGFEASIMNRVCDTPIRIASEHRRGALYHHESLRTEVSRYGFVERSRVELTKRIIGRVGKIDDDEIEALGARVHPGKRVGVDDVNLGRGSAP